MKELQEQKMWNSFVKWLENYSDKEDIFIIDCLLSVVIRSTDALFSVTSTDNMCLKHKDYFRNKRNSFVGAYLMQTQQDPRVMLREESIELFKDFIQLLNTDSFPNTKSGEFIQTKRLRQAKATLTKKQQKSH